MQGIGEFELGPPAAFWGWLKAIAEHRLQDAIKAEKRQKRGGGRQPVANPENDGSSSFKDLLDALFQHENTPSRSAARHEREQAVKVALAGLPEDQRQAIQLHCLEGLSLAEVAARMDCTEGAVRMRCLRGKEKLREALGSASDYLSSDE